MAPHRRARFDLHGRSIAAFTFKDRYWTFRSGYYSPICWLGTPLDGPVQGCVHHNLFPNCRRHDYRRARDRPGGNRSLFDRRSDPDWKNGPLAVCLVPMGRKPVFGSRLWRVVASGASMEAYLRHAEVTGWMMNEAHNGYLDALAQTGIIGLLLLGFFVLSGFLIVLFARQRELQEPNVWKWFAMYVTLGMLFGNITESGFFNGPDWLIFVFMCASALLSRGYSQGIAGRDVRSMPELSVASIRN